MMHETSPDTKDGHTHQVDLDDSRDGHTTEAGKIPHSHDVHDGVVMAYKAGAYVSEHPGELTATGPESDEVESKSGSDPNPSTPAMEDRVTWSVLQIMEGQDPQRLADSLLFD